MGKLFSKLSTWFSRYEERRLKKTILARFGSQKRIAELAMIALQKGDRESLLLIDEHMEE